MTQIIDRHHAWGDTPEPRGPMLTAVPTATNLTMAQAINGRCTTRWPPTSGCWSSVKTSRSSAACSGLRRPGRNIRRAKVFRHPLAESAIIGIAIGFAIRGFIPVPEIQFDGFSYPAFDQMVSHLAKYRMRTRGDVDMPVTVRIPSFGGIGAVEHHSESTESYWLHTAGLKVVPSTPSDAYWLLRHAIASRDPVIYLEPKRRYWGRKPSTPPNRVADRARGDPVHGRRRHRADLRRPGSHRDERRRAGRRPARLEPGGRRPAIAEPARLRHRRSLGAQDRSRGGDA